MRIVARIKEINGKPNAYCVSGSSGPKSLKIGQCKNTNTSIISLNISSLFLPRVTKGLLLQIKMKLNRFDKRIT